MPTFLRSLIPCVLLGLGVTLIALPSGCRRTSGRENATVRGMVTFQGQPLAGGLVVFTPDVERGGAGKPIRADVGTDGTFQLKTAGETAVAPGWYRVTIAPGVDPAARAGLPSFPPQLAHPRQSGLVREVKAAQENVFGFAIEVPNQ